MNPVRIGIMTVVALVGVGFANSFFFRTKTVQVEEIEEVVVKKTSRKPASAKKEPTPAPRIQRPSQGITTEARNNKLFNDQPVEAPEVAGQAPVEKYDGGIYSGGPYSPSGRPQPSRSSSNPSQSSGNKGSSAPSANSGNIVAYNVPTDIFDKVVDDPTKPQTPQDNPTDPSPQSPIPTPPEADPEKLTCVASQGSGAFSSSIAVTLSCSSAAEIKYCLQQGSCCDPVVAYTGPITIGAQDGDYCLTFYGEASSAASMDSDETNHNYTVNVNLPDLQLSVPKIFFQTTELPSIHHLYSSDSGAAGFEMGEINLKSHNPEEMTCEEIYESHTTFTNPAMSIVMAFQDLLGIPSGNQVNVPFEVSNLAYGANYITSFVIDRNHPAPAYACSTNKVILKDFEFFAAEASHGDPGNNDVREFSGSFVSYGVFEPTEVVSRAPAGLDDDANSGQELNVGSFAVFY